MLSCVDLSLGHRSRSMMQLKITALMGAELCRSLSEALRDWPSPGELSVHRLVQVMDGQDLAFPSLNDGEAEHFRASLRRLNTVGQYAKDNGVRVLVDAEYTYLNPAITLVTVAMMMRFNQTEPSIWNTYQCYLKDAYSLLSADISRASSLGYCFGVKLVRGAYMDKERQLARTLGYADPIHENWEATNRSYQKLLDQMLDLVGEQRERYSVVIASHNETSVRHALN
uniref:hydroxyproline dehydrogenase n=1 Tax=Pristiophorus japonicus TaxID=55135 RepID=UPI00398EDED1